MKKCLFLFCCMLNVVAYAQQTVTVKVIEKATSLSLPFVNIIDNDKFLATTDSAGNAILNVTAGIHRFSFQMQGYTKLDTTIDVQAPLTVTLALSPLAASLEEVTIVASTRNNQNIENSPLKVEVLGAEELGEEASIKPGNIASILGDVSGVQIQQSSATSGNSNVRVQGLEGRYTQILRDGMPLYDGFSGGFGILTIPPLDLMQIELIKGSASTLYGGGAIGGLVNLISKRPKVTQELDALVNYTTLKEFNVNVYAARRKNKFGYTLFAGYNNQQPIDVNKDGLSDLPDAASFIVHPKLFYYPSQFTAISLGYSGSIDDRIGGDMLVLQNKSDAVHQYFEHNTSQRHTGEFLLEHTFPKNAKFTVKGNTSYFNKQTTAPLYLLQGTQVSYYGEASIYTPIGKHNLVAGVNTVGDDYETKVPDNALLKTYRNFTAGAFGQFSYNLKEHTILEAGLRTDHHDRYGFFVLPRIAGFHRFNEHWAMRAGFGMGYKVPNPLAQQNIDYDPLVILPVGSTVVPEISYGYNAEVNYKVEWGSHNSFFVNQAFFLTDIEHPILFSPTATANVELINAPAPVVSKGSDTYVRLILSGWELYLGYTFTDARNKYLPDNFDFIRLTPKNRWAFVVAKEIKEAWRFGLEGSYTGSQFRYDNTQTPSYFFMAAMVQRNIGKHISIVLNCENLLDYRMSKVESLYVGTITNPVFKPLWAPIDGRVVNLSLRWKL